LREYEVMLILPAEADEKVVSTAIDRITRVISARGGEVAEIDRWGRRRFAYELDRLHEGYYVVATFTAEPTAQPELERALNLADEVIRYKVLVLPAKRTTTAAVAERRSTETANEAEASPAPA
jgi:small subunit ribosomal protein S6